MIKISAAEQIQLQESRSENVVVQKKIAAIRGGKVMEFVGKAIEHGGEMVDAAAEISEESSKGGDIAAPLRKVGKNAGAILEGTSRVITDSWEKVKENVRQGEWGQSVRWWLLDHGSTAAFDSKIAKHQKKVENLEDKKNREARQFDELHEKFKSGEMNEMDIERNKRAHLAEFDKILEKERAKQEEEKKKKEEHEKEVQELKNRINDRITAGINNTKLETNYDLNKERQGELKVEIIKAEGLLTQTKKEHKELEDKCKLLYGDSWLRKKFNVTRKEVPYSRTKS